MPAAASRRAETAAYALLLAAVGLAYLAIASQITAHYHPVWSDEFLYYLNAASFVENHTLQAALTYNGSGSELLGADSHGPAYPLLHGTIARLVGWHSRNLVWFNLAAVGAAVGALGAAKFPGPPHRLKVICLVLLFPFIPLYAVSYMQEMIHVLVAVLLSVVVWRIYHAEHNGGYIGLFVGLLVLAALFRPLWLFWLVGLLPAAKSGRQLVLFLLLLVVSVAGSFAYFRLCYEAVSTTLGNFFGLWQHQSPGQAGLFLLRHLLDNLRQYPLNTGPVAAYLPMKLAVLGLVAFFAVRAYRGKGRFDTALAAIGAVNLGLLLVIYDAHSWREIRTMAPVFYFLLPFFVLHSRPLVHHLAAAVSVLLFGLTLPTTQQWLAERNVLNEPSRARVAAFEELRRVVPDKSVIRVGYPARDNSRDLLDLPLRNRHGSPIKYMVPYYLVPAVRPAYLLGRPHQFDNRLVLMDNAFYQLVKNN